MAIEYSKNALNLAPDDDQIKVAFAETSLEMETQGNIPIRGKKRTYHLYEVKALRDPLEDGEKIPQKLCDRYSKVINKLIEYPEAIVLPVEAMALSGIPRGWASYLMPSLITWGYRARKRRKSFWQDIFVTSERKSLPSTC